MKIAIMQPYFFPYIGYFQLINAVDKFVFYDDVNYIKRGWVNRNKILINNNPTYFTVQIKEASQNKLINELDIDDNRNRIKKSIQMAYKRAPLYNQVWPVINKCMEYETNSISELAIISVREVCDYLEINTQFELSSEKYGDTREMNREDRLKAICKLNKAEHYINQIGGKELYGKHDFRESGINLSFLSPILPEYQQFSGNFIPSLSIIDVLMFNSVKNIHKMLNNYEIL